MVHQLGVGSIGTLLAHHIRLSNPLLPTTLISRNPSLYSDKIQIQTTSPSLQSTSTSTSKGYTIRHPSEIQEEEIQSLLITTKAPSTLSAIKPLVTKINKNSVIALLQNGMGVYRELLENIWPKREEGPTFILGTTNHGVSPVQLHNGKRGTVKHHSALVGEIKWGIYASEDEDQDILENWLFPSTSSLSSSLLSKEVSAIPPLPPYLSKYSTLRDTLQILLSANPLRPSLIPKEEMEQALLLKLAVNAVVNPLTALLGRGRGEISNGALLSPMTGRMVDALIEETSKVLQAHLSGNGQRNKETFVELFSPDSLKSRVENVLKATYSNISSMSLDLANGRMTEIDYINGYIVRLGKEAGVQTPLNEMMKDMIRFVTVTFPNGKE